MADYDPEVIGIIEAEMNQPVSDAVRALADEMRGRHGRGLLACLFYGSCLRDGMERDRVIDFYAVVRDYRSFHGSFLGAAANALLPPNVYYLEITFEQQVLRAKYAVISLMDLSQDTAPACFLPTLWGRLAQPCALVFADGTEVEQAVAQALAGAVRTTASQTLLLMPAEFTPRQLWERAFAESYRTELRAERRGRAAALYEAYPHRFDRLAPAVLAPLGVKRVQGQRQGRKTAILRYAARSGGRRVAQLRWWGRRVLGKTFHILRLAKAAYTFAGGLDYILWKIETHSGIKTEPTPWQRRHPLIAAPKLAWQLYRRGAFR